MTVYGAVHPKTKPCPHCGRDTRITKATRRLHTHYESPDGAYCPGSGMPEHATLEEDEQP